MTKQPSNPPNLLQSTAGATLLSYAITTGAVALVCIFAITYLNYGTEKRVQELGDKAGKSATIKGGASLGGEVAKSTAIMGGMELPFQFGIPLFTLPALKKKEKEKKPDERSATNDKSCPGGNCPKGQSTCFVAGTLVLTPNGYRKIEDIRVGDEVLSVAEDSPWATAAVDETPMVFDAIDAIDAEGAAGAPGESEPRDVAEQSTTTAEPALPVGP
jgi:hypothetical protein